MAQAERESREWTEDSTAKRYTDYAPSDVESYDLDDSHTPEEQPSPKVWNRSPSWLRRILPLPQRKSTFGQDQTSPSRRNVASLAISAFAGFVLCLLLQAILGVTNSSIQSLPGLAASSLIPASNTTVSSTIGAQKVMTKPEGVKVIGIMFYGRPMFVNILNCYLQKNLVSNGGWLDEIHFIANTKHQEDLEYLDRLVEFSEGQYKRINQTGDWTKLWTHVGTLNKTDIIVKIDDDVVYLHPDAIPRIVTSVISHPEAFAVGGNIINTPHSHFWQYHTGGLLPYLPDENPVPLNATLTWRASQLPISNATYPKSFDWQYHEQPRHVMTRWLPLPRTSRNLWKTPAVKANWPNPRGGATMFTYAGEISSWAMAAQVHYSFLEHLENDAIEKVYTNFGNSDDLWNQQYERYSINFMAARAGRISREDFWLNDEVCITMTVPEGHKEPFLIDMGAVASHYSFSSQHELLQTDLLNRYLAYANEMVCAPDRQILPMVSSMVRTGN